MDSFCTDWVTSHSNHLLPRQEAPASWKNSLLRFHHKYYTKWDAHEMNTDILFSLITQQILSISYTSPLVSSMSLTVLSDNIEYNRRLQLNILIQQVWKDTCSELHYSKLTRQSTCKWCRAVVVFVFRYSFERETGQWNALWDIVCQLLTYIPQIPETELKTIITSPFRKNNFKAIGKKE